MIAKTAYIQEKPDRISFLHVDDISNYDEETLIYGLSFDLLKGLVIWTGIEEKGYEKARNQADYDTYQVGLAVSF